MEDDRELRKQRDRLGRLHRQMEALLGRTDTALDAMTTGAPSAGSIRQMDRLRGELEALIRSYLDQSAAFLTYVTEQARRMEENRATMAEQRSRPPRNQARIEQLSEELTRDLRLQRVDAAIKEILDFLTDADFFAANAGTGRRRRLRALQNAIEKALQ